MDPKGRDERGLRSRPAVLPAAAGGTRPAPGHTGGRAQGRSVDEPAEGAGATRPRPLIARPISLRATRAGGRPTGPIPLPAFRAGGEREARTAPASRDAQGHHGPSGPTGPGAAGGGGGVAGEAGAVAGPGPNQGDDIRRSLWVRRPDLFYGQPNRGHHRAAFAEPLVPDRERVVGTVAGVRPEAEASEGGRVAAPRGGEPAARRREGAGRVPVARELLPTVQQAAPPAAGYAPGRPEEGRVDDQVARQLTQRPSPSSHGRPIAAADGDVGPDGAARGERVDEATADRDGNPASRHAGRSGPGTGASPGADAAPSRADAAGVGPLPTAMTTAPVAGRGDPVADVIPSAESATAGGRSASRGPARDEPAPPAGTGEAPVQAGEAARAEAGSSAPDAAVVQDVGGAPVPLNAAAVGAVAEGPGIDPGRGDVAGGGPPVGAEPANPRLDAATELRSRPVLRTPLRPRAVAAGRGTAEGLGRLPGDRTTDASALTRGTIREARARWQEADSTQVRAEGVSHRPADGGGAGLANGGRREEGPRG